MKKHIYTVFILLAGVLWGVIGVFGRLVGAYGFSSMQITALRLATGSMMIVLFVALTDPKKLRINIRDLPIFIAMGLGSSMLMSFLYLTAIEYTSLSIAAILLYTAPIFVLFSSALLYHEKLTARKLVATALAFLGCMMVSGIGGRVSFIGVLFGLGSGVAYALYSILGKKALMKYHPFTVTAYAFTIGAIGAVALSKPAGMVELLAQGMETDGTMMLVKILGAGFTTIFLPYILYTLGLSQTQAGKASIMASVEPMTATVAGIVLYHEMPDAFGYIGIALILAAIVLLNLSPKKKTDPASGNPEPKPAE